MSIVKPLPRPLIGAGAFLLLGLLACDGGDGRKNPDLRVAAAGLVIEAGTGEEVAAAAPEDLPDLLSELGQYADLDWAAPAPGVIPYEVAYPLWSDGAIKSRTLRLPQDGVVESDDSGWYRFPDGTVVTKAFNAPAAPEGRSTARIETRVLLKSRGRWQLAAYVWDKDGKEARRVEDDTPMNFTLPGCTEPYVVPGRIKCLQCHGGVADGVIGIAPFQMKEELRRELRRRGQIEEEAAHAIPAEGDLERRAIGYLSGNCAHCHNPLSPAYDGDELDLRPDHVAEATIGVAAQRLVRPDSPFLVTPGSAERSILHRLLTHSYSQERDGDREKRMPPIGNASVDTEGARLVKQWIDSLESN